MKGMVFALAVGAMAFPRAAAAQDTVVVTRGGLPVDERAVALFNAESTTRLYGEPTISRGTTLHTDVAVFDGRLSVYGRIEGDLVAINADVSIYAGAEVGGDVLVLGGTLFISAQADVRGSAERHSERVSVRVVEGRLELTGEPVRRVMTHRDHRLRRSYGVGRTSIALITGRTYNRVEGLPVLVGPRLTWSESEVQLRLEGLAVFRSGTGFGVDYDQRELGYVATGSMRMWSGWRLELGGKAYDVVDPIESWQLRDDEVGLASLLWHRDYRDYYLNRGVSGLVRLSPADGLTLFGGIARDQVTSVATRDPWTPFRGNEPWRPNPAVDQGHFNLLSAGIEVDTRTGRRSWGTGVLLRAEWERGRSNDVSPVALPLTVRSPLPLTSYSYDRLFADLRFQQPVGWGGLQLRAVGGGVVGDGELPIQRRFSLGGPDPMPGFPFRQFACNAAAGDPAFPALCDRMVLFQAEYRGGFDFNPLDREWDSRSTRGARGRDWSDWMDFSWDWEGPQFVLFADAGNAWLARAGFPGGLKWDAGAGLELGSVGVYAARAIERDQPVRFIVRIHRRF